MAVDESTNAALDAVRDSLAGIRATCMMLTGAGQQYLGHANICHTVRYTELSPTRFSGFWKEGLSLGQA